ncbi:hypothetical protein FWH13_00290 [Candidatus Saccharibacteria bacterium]|nr:hypothetical protein [Candidatus Saccharibacteria bacterium]
MKLLPKILIGLGSTTAVVATTAVINPFGIANSVPVISQAREAYLMGRIMAGTDPKDIASEKEICLLSDKYEHGRYTWFDEPHYAGMQQQQIEKEVPERDPNNRGAYTGNMTTVYETGEYVPTYKNCIGWKESITDDKGVYYEFSSPDDYIRWLDADRERREQEAEQSRRESEETTRRMERERCEANRARGYILEGCE